MTKQHIAIFDLDETLTKKGTWGRFVVASIRGRPLKYIPFIIQTAVSQLFYMLGFGPREHVKEAMMRCTISGRTRTELEILAENFAQFEAYEGLRPQARVVIDKHRKAGDRIIIASAAVDLIVNSIAQHLGITEIVCTKMAYTKDEKLAKKLGGENCYGAHKLTMVKSYLAADSKYRRSHVHITMYSDSGSDLDILRWADVGIAVHPRKRLAKYVAQYGFEIQIWD
ncbi:MAG: HAD-IB family hydrolase [Robiginitomaculum sp.]|nr:HAD-IB family hydrolase [Robiginitomaculum sp.]